MQLLQKRQTWNPFGELEDLSSRFNRLFGMTRPLAGNGESEALAAADWYPSCDISETEKEYRIQAELPSVKKEDVHVTFQDGVLTIRGDRKVELEHEDEKDRRYHRRELVYGSFVRSFSMPDDANEAKVDATFKDGMLNIVVARMKESKPKARQIAVH